MKDTIVIHCLATRPAWWAERSVQEKTAEVRRWHVEDNGWRDIAYAMIIDRDGSRAKGRDLDGDGDVWEEIGAGVRGHNKREVHVALVGGHGSSAQDDFFDHFTGSQDRALRRTIAEIQSHFGRKMKLRGHNEYANKACPGFQVSRWFHGKTPSRTSPAESKSVRVGSGGVVGSVVAGFTALSELDGTAQMVAICAAAAFALLFAYLIRDRLKKWGRGIK